MAIKTQTFTGGGGGGAVTGGLVYKGTFNATTGSPSLANAKQGDYYKIATGGTIYGQTWAINDSLLINADMGGSITNSKIDKIDNTEPTNVLITTNNLNDLDNVATAKTNLGLQTVASTGAYSDLSGTPTLGTAAAANTGTGIGQVVIMEDVGSVAKLPAVDGSQLINLPSAPVTSVNTLTGAVVVSGNDLAADHSASHYTAANSNIDGHLSGIDSKFGTLGTAAIYDVGTGSNNIVRLNGDSKIPAVDGSLLENVGKFTDYTTLSSNSNIFKNKGYNITADSLTLTLPARSTLTDGDSIAFTSAASYSLTIQLNSADSSTSNIFYNVATGTNASSHTITINKQEIFIRFNGSSFLITSETKGGIADVVSDTSPQLGGSLDVNGQDIVSVSNGDIEVAPDGNGSFIIKGNATSGSGRIVLNCEQNSHGITLKGPPHSAAASYTLTLPNDDGDAGEVLKTDGSGNLDWVAQSGGSSAPTVTSASTTTTYPSSGDLASSGLEQIYLLTPTNNTTVNLAPAATCGSGFKYQIKNLGTYTITIDPDGSETIDTSATFAISDQYTSITLVTDGSNWFII